MAKAGIPWIKVAWVTGSIAAVVILLSVVGVLQIEPTENGWLNLPDFHFTLNIGGLNGEDNGNGAPPPAPVSIEPDLREIFNHIISDYPTVVTLCPAGGGTWHWEADYVGCEGFCPLNCSSPPVIFAMAMCRSQGASAVCSPTDAYCRL